MTTRTLSPYPLASVRRQWQPFLEQADTPATLRIGGMLLQALACESSARVLYMDGWQEYEQDRNGLAMCYSLCAVLNEFVESSGKWAQIADSLDEQLKQEEDEYLRQLYDLSVHTHRRVSFLQFTVQSELQDVAKAHKVLLSIGILDEPRQEEETSDDR